MTAMFKLFLLFTMAAVSFVPPDGVDAILCHCAGGCLSKNSGIPSKGCSGGPELCVTKLSAGQSSVDAHRDCANKEEDERALKLKNGCVDIYPSRICVCDTDNCNDKPILAPTTTTPSSTSTSGGRVHAWTSSVLNGIFVLFIHNAVLS